MRIGYARVSTGDQNPDMQQQALRDAGCERIFTDTASGATRDRAALRDALNVARTGDTLVIWRLNRLGRSLRDLIDISIDLKTRGIELVSLGERIDTGSVAGRLYFHIIASVDESERERIRERAMCGLAAARARGVKVGRKPRLSPAQANAVYALYESEIPVVQICEQFGVSRDTVWRTVAKVRALRESRSAPADRAGDAASEPPTQRGTSNAERRRAG